MVINTTETVKVPASFLVSGFQGLSTEIQAKVIELAREQSKAKAENRELEASVVEEVAGLLPENMRKELAAVGATLPSDQIDLTMRLGDFLYHTYAFNTKPSQAPLALKRHEKRLMELAEALDKEEIEVPSDVLKTAEEVMADETKWDATQFGAILTVDGNSKYLGLSALGASIFRKVVDSAVSLFEVKKDDEHTK